MSHSYVLRTSALAGIILAAINFIYQSLLWFSELNEFGVALLFFYAIFPIVLVVNLYFLRRKGGRFFQLFLSGVIVSIIGGLGIIAMMYFYLNIVGGGVLPPVLEATIAQLEADQTAGKDVSDKLNSYRSFTPTSFALFSGIQNTIIGVVETIIISAILMFIIRRPNLNS